MAVDKADPPASLICSDPGVVVGQMASLLGTSNIRVQRLYQASTDGWKPEDCTNRTSGHGGLLYVARTETEKLIGAYTEQPVGAQALGSWVDSPASFLFSMEAATGKASLVYVERPLAEGRAYAVVESAHPVYMPNARSEYAFSYGVVDLPNTTAYTIDFDARTRFGPADNSAVNVYDLRQSMANASGALLSATNQTIKQYSVNAPALLLQHHVYTYGHPQQPWWGYKLVAMSNASTRAKVRRLDMGVAFGADNNNRLVFDLRRREITEPTSIDDTRAGYESAPREGCARFFSGAGRTTITELEVWKIEAVPASGELPDPTHPIILNPMTAATSSGAPRYPATLPLEVVKGLWGNIDFGRGGLEQDMQYLRNYKPYGLERVNFLLCGGVGSGKSTVINSLLSAVNPDVVHVAKVFNQSTSVTSDVNLYELQSTRDDLPGFITTRINLWDTPGFTFGTTADTYKHGQLSYILEGCIPDGFKGPDKQCITPGTEGVKLAPTVADTMHVVLLTVNHGHLKESNSAYMARVAEFIAQITNPASPHTRTLQPVILLTQVDTLDERIKTDKSLLFSSGLVMSAREVASMKTGVPVDRVLPITGYYNQCAQDPPLNRLLVFILRRALVSADSHLFNLKKAKLISAASPNAGGGAPTAEAVGGGAKAAV